MRHPRRLAAAACAGLALLATIYRPFGIAGVDRRIYDALSRPPSAPAPAARVAIVAIDDSSIAALGQWPWPRDVMARLVDRLGEMRANVIAIDLMWTEKDRDTSGSSPSTDARLAASLSRVPGTVVAHLMLFDDRQGDARCAPAMTHVVERQRGDAPVTASLFRSSGIVCALEPLLRSAAASGFINAGPDPDGILRRIPVLMAHGDDVYPSLALAAVQQATKSNRIDLEGRGDGSMWAAVGGQRVALDAGGRLLLRYLGSSGTVPKVSAAAVLDRSAPDDAVRDRIVFIGPTALGLGDVVSTAHDRRFPGVEVHATAAENLLSASAYSRPPSGEAIELFSAVAAVLVAVLLVIRLGIGGGAALMALLLAIGWAGSYAAMRSMGVYLSPLFATMGGILALAAETAMTVVRERQRADTGERRNEETHRLIIQTLTSLTETRSPTTGRHARRTRAYARLLAAALAEDPRRLRIMTMDDVDRVAAVAPLHDIGKVGIADSVLNKPGPLNDEEWTEMRRHPDLGYQALISAETAARVHNDEMFALAKEVVRTHHEHWDGLGYPRGLAGSAIPLAGRIVALVDVYDALVSMRPYRNALPHDEAVRIIAGGRGTHFDPEIVDAFLKVQHAFRELAERGPDREPIGP
jgi:adenylate cyclase